MHKHCVHAAASRMAPRLAAAAAAPASSTRMAAVARPQPQPQPQLRLGSSAARTAHTPRHGARSSLVCRAQNASDLPSSLQKIVGAFQMVPDPMARYKQLLFLANKLEPLPADDHCPENKVEGCVSQVWVKPELRDDGKVYWRADSDSALTKGLAALLVQGLSGCTPQEILSTQPDFIEMLGLKQSLTPSRNNGFLNMFKLMQMKTASLAAGSSGGGGGDAEEAAMKAAGRNIVAAAVVMSASVSSTPIADAMRQKLGDAIAPVRMDIVDESSQHAGHAGRMLAPGKAGVGGETHFKVFIVSEAFEGMSLIKRHRWVNSLLEDEFGMGLHALSLVTKTPSEAGV